VTVALISPGTGLTPRGSRIDHTPQNQRHRPGTVHSIHDGLAILKRIVAAVRARWPEVTLELRADSGFAIPAVYDYCETEQITYTIGLVPNPRLQRAVAPLRAEAAQQSGAQGGAKVRLIGETSYQAASWSAPRRVVMKAEILPKGANSRFVVTTRASRLQMRHSPWRSPLEDSVPNGVQHSY